MSMDDTQEAPLLREATVDELIQRYVDPVATYRRLHAFAQAAASAAVAAERARHAVAEAHIASGLAAAEEERDELRSALAAGPAPAGEPVAWMTLTDEGDPAMLFFDRAEAVQYCDDGEQPTPLYEASTAGTPSVDAEALIAAAVPGGSVCDPQQVADEIRRYLNQWPADTPSSYLGKPDNSPAVALGSLHAVASRLRLSGVDDDVAASLAQQIADAAAALNAVTPRPDQPLAVVSSEGLGPSAQPVERMRRGVEGTHKA